MPLSTTFQIPPELQYKRDLIALQLLQQEKDLGISQISGMLVNSSKNPKKELWKDTGIEGEIARRKLIMNDLLQRIPTNQQKSQQQQKEQETSYPDILQALQTFLLGEH